MLCVMILRSRMHNMWTKGTKLNVAHLRQLCVQPYCWLKTWGDSAISVTAPCSHKHVNWSVYSLVARVFWVSADGARAGSMKITSKTLSLPTWNQFKVRWQTTAAGEYAAQKRFCLFLWKKKKLSSREMKSGKGIKMAIWTDIFHLFVCLLWSRSWKVCFHEGMRLIVHQLIILYHHVLSTKSSQETMRIVSV